MSQESAINVARVVWPWRTAAIKPGAGRLSHRWRAVIQAALIAAVASLFRFIGHRYGISLFLYCLSAAVLISGLFIPPVFNAFEQAGRWLGKWVGVGLTWLLLIPFYYLCVFPGRLVLLLLGKDPMCRRWERQRDSYWMDRKPAAPEFYTRQY